MNRILVAYATMAGSTAEVAQAVAEEIGKSGFQEDVLPLSQVKDLQGYAGVVVGGPMIMGWHRAALRFLKKHRKDFQHIPLAVFTLAMSLTQTEETSPGGATSSACTVRAASPRSGSCACPSPCPICSRASASRPASP